MGSSSSMDKPKVEKESECRGPSGDLRLAYASSCMQGWRTGMEDAHICIPSYNEGLGEGSDKAWRGLGIFGVFDGHGGEQVAKFCHRHIPEELHKFPLDNNKENIRNGLEAAFTGAFHRMDDMLRESKYIAELHTLSNESHLGHPRMPGRPHPDEVGCTACVCCITADEIMTANAGDSRAVLCKAGRAVPLSEDHKPNDPRERRRIEAAGGHVQFMGEGMYRVNGNLNLSRAIGDLQFKRGVRLKPEEQVIAATPDVTFWDRSAEDEFLIICCDGVWDMMQNQEVVDFVRQRLPKNRDVQPKDMERILEALLDRCLSPNLRSTEGLGGDNMTAVLVWMDKGEEVPRLASIQAKPDTATAGAIVVTVDLPQWCSLNDLFLNISEAAAAVHVGVKHQPVSQGGHGCSTVYIDLAEHLPTGAIIPVPTEEDKGGGAKAKFLLKRRQMRISVPWQQPEQK